MNNKHVTAKGVKNVESFKFKQEWEQRDGEEKYVTCELVKTNQV